MKKVELAIRGEVERLELRAGDVIVVTLDGNPRRDEVEGLFASLRASEAFAGHQIVVLAAGRRLTVARESALPPGFVATVAEAVRRKLLDDERRGA